jgi:hypothetical protein
MKPTNSLKAIMGAPYKKVTFENSAEYSQYLESLNKARLQDICMSEGLIPSHERRMMIRALEKQFKRHLAAGVRVTDHKQLVQEKRKNLKKSAK